MARTTTNYVQTVIKLIRGRQHRKLFRLIKEIGAMGERGREIIRRLALYYPIICRMFHDAGRLEDFKESLNDEWGGYGLYTILNKLNEEFLLATGCDCCSDKIDLISAEANDFIRHIGHRWFREWAYKHYSEEFRARVLYSIEAIREIEKKRGKRIFLLDDD